MTNKKNSFKSKVLLVCAGLCLIVSLLVPMWSIYLDAPQYPEGLSLQIWAGKLAGDVDIINGLNHYIGMKTLHSNDFAEFAVLPYIIMGFAVLFFITAFWGNRKWLYFVLGAFVIFGIVAMVDFWKWEYDYGHHLNPDAAIKVPGMTYQPPLIGFKQLLNFGAYSVPDIGGWLLIVAGVLLVLAVFIEVKTLRRLKHKIPLPVFIAAMMAFASCGNDGPVAINYNKDACEYCKMTIADSRFAAELITTKGRVYKFDDVSCMLKYARDGNVEVKKYYIGNFLKDKDLIDATTAFYVHHAGLRSPMGGNVAAFSNKEQAKVYAEKNNVSVITWDEVKNSIAASNHHNHGH